MFAITESVAKINGRNVDTFNREISNGRTALEVEAGTTGFVGEDCRDAGGRTYVGINCICGDFHFEPVKNDNGQTAGIKIACCGCISHQLSGIQPWHYLLDGRQDDGAAVHYGHADGSVRCLAQLFCFAALGYDSLGKIQPLSHV